MKKILLLPVIAVVIAGISICSNDASGIAATTISLSSSQPTSTYGFPVNFTATIIPDNGTVPDGETVTFFDGNDTLGTSTTIGGLATLTLSSLPAGDHLITASYDGDANYSSSTSTAIVQTVNQDNTTTSLSSSGSPSFYGQPLTFTTVVSSSTGSVPDGEAVAFLDGNATIGSSNTTGGMAEITISDLTLGNHSITATYAGDANYLPSTSPVALQAITTVQTVTTLSSAANPAPYGQPLAFTAFISTSTGLLPDGETVKFFDGDTVIGTAVTSGNTATFTTSSLSAGTHSISATFTGDADYATSSSEPISQSVEHGTATAISSSPNPSVYGQAVSLTATITPDNGTVPDGETVTFLDSGTVVGAGTTSGNTATVTIAALSIGTHSITATYPGDRIYMASTSPEISQTVNKSSAQIMGTATKCTSISNCSFIMSYSNATGFASTGGTVNFQLPTELKSSSGPYTIQYRASGAIYHVTGQFSATDTNNGKVVTGWTNIFVKQYGHSGRGGGIYYTLVNGSITFNPTNLDATTAAVTCNPSSVPGGQASICTANVNDTLNPSNMPMGTVYFSASNGGIGSFVSSTCNLSSGNCSVEFKTNPEYGSGTTSIYATYDGDGGHYPSNSRTLLYSTASGNND